MIHNSQLTACGVDHPEIAGPHVSPCITKVTALNRFTAKL